MNHFPVAQPETADAFDPGKDPFTLHLIGRKVSQLLLRPSFRECDREDLTQEFLARVVKGLKQFNPSVGHRYPLIVATVERYVSNVLNNRHAAKRDGGKVASLNVLIQLKDVGSTELIHTIGDREADRRTGRERRLSEEQLADLRLDLKRVISEMPQPWQELLERRPHASLSQIARDMGIPRTTLGSWMRRIRERFEEAGLAEYLVD